MFTTVATLLLKRIAAAFSSDKQKKSKFLMVIVGLVLGLILLFLMPIAVYQSFGYMESPDVDVYFDEAAFWSQLSPEQQENIAAVEDDGQAIADAMAAAGLREQTIKAQLIYMSYFDGRRISDFAGYAGHFYQDNEQLIQSLNFDYSLAIDYNEYIKTYLLVMNSTINEYMFSNTAEKNAADLAAWCRNVAVSGWGYGDYCIGERTGENRLRCADNIGLIMGYIRYDTYNKVFTSDIVDMYYSEQGCIETMPDIQGIGVFNDTYFGVYVGGGEVVFSSAIGGCVQQPLDYGNWTNWCTFDAVSYPQEVWDRVNELQSEAETEGE